MVRRWKVPVVAAAGSLALAGGMVAGALPASASAPPTQSWGVSAWGNQDLNPVGYAQTGDSPAVASHAVIAGLLATGGMQDSATAGDARSLVLNTVVQLPGGATLTAGSVRSACWLGAGEAYGTASIASGSVIQIGNTAISIPANPAPNTTIDIPGADITVNAQHRYEGFLDVHAVNIWFTSSPHQAIHLGNTTCYVIPPG